MFLCIVIKAHVQTMFSIMFWLPLAQEGIGQVITKVGHYHRIAFTAFFQNVIDQDTVESNALVLLHFTSTPSKKKFQLNCSELMAICQGSQILAIL